MGDLPVIEARTIFDSLVLRNDLDKLPTVVYPECLERHQGRAGPEETHLHTYVPRLLLDMITSVPCINR